MRKTIVVLLVTLGSAALFAAGASEAASAGSSSRGAYLADQGVIVPPEEVHVNSYVASIDYSYPDPEQAVGVTLFSGNGQLSASGQEGLLHVGIQGRRRAFEDLPSLNVVFVIDISSSMDEQDKLAWIKEGFAIFLDRVRDKDFVSVVVFNNEARVVFPSTRMGARGAHERLKAAVGEIEAGGGSNLEQGLERGYEQVMVNYRSDYTNRVLFLSDGTEMSSRLARAGAKSGDVRISLMWNNRNDLDLHVVDPAGVHIFFGNKRSRTRGELDVDMNVRGETTKPVENIYWPLGGAPEGSYKVFVVNYGYHDRRVDETPFVVEVQNRNEISRYEDVFPGFSAKRRRRICEFEFRGTSGRRRELSMLEEMAAGYRELGVNVSTIGVGMAFDMELMTRLSRAGGGSSRFIANHEGMEKIFGSEFDRMVVPAARNLEMELRFMPGVRILETWGYEHRIDGSVVTFSQATLHNRDYETILVRYRLPPQERTGLVELARFGMHYEELDGAGRRIAPAVARVEIVEGEAPVAGYSNGTVLRSGTMLRFALNMRRIGELYYTPELMASLAAGVHEVGGRTRANLDQAMEVAVATKKDLLNARLRLDDTAFDDEIEIMDSYIQTLGRMMGMEEARVALRSRDTQMSPNAVSRPLNEHLDRLFREISLDLASRRGVVAVSGFTAREGDSGLTELLNETAATHLSRVSTFTLVERTRLYAVLAEQELALSDLMDTGKAVGIGKLVAADFIVTGSVVPTSSTVVIFGRVIDTESGEVVSAAQIIVPRSGEVSSLLI
jgi:Ca-activated chloride channel family protein